MGEGKTMKNVSAEQGGAHAAPTQGKLGLVEMQSMRSRAQQYFAREGEDPLSQAFERKTVVHAGMSGRPLRDEARDEAMERLLGEPRQGQSAAYFHIPFCETHCLYCGFYAAAYKRHWSAAYVDALLEDMRRDRDLPAVCSKPIHAVYLGGGTPTAFEAGDLRRLLLGIRKYLPLANDCEITVEGRVFRFDPEKIRACIEGGANRFSIGVQTFNTDIRQQLGRVCSRDEVCEVLDNLLRTDSAAVIIDLIYGLPGQGEQEWAEDLRVLEQMGLDGCDLYQLNVFPGGRLDKALQRGEVSPVADVPGQGRLFRQGVEFLRGRRYRRLSISHWGRTTRERNIYNPLMKRRADCLAFGSGAGGSLRGHFYFLESDVKKYMAAREQGRRPVAMIMEPPANAGLVRVLTGQLESGALDLARTRQETGVDVDGLYAPLLQQWQRAGLLRRDGDWIELTLAGQFWQVNITQALIDWHTQNAMEI